MVQRQCRLAGHALPPLPVPANLYPKDFAPTAPMERPQAVVPALRRQWLPGLCAVCRSWQTQAVCADCLRRFAPPRPCCSRCALPLPHDGATCGACLIAPPPQRHTVAALDYGYPWDRLIAGVKFHDQVPLARPLAELLAHAVRRAGLSLPDAVLPVPMTPQRLRERGVHHTWELTRRVARCLSIPAWADTVARHHEAPPQLGLDREARLRNVRGAFEVPSAARPRLAGRRVAVVDDVMTTGATAGALAHGLLEAGASEVQVWVVARATVR